jgi:hypothetical protein
MGIETDQSLRGVGDEDCVGRRERPALGIGESRRAADHHDLDHAFRLALAAADGDRASGKRDEQ